jgi:hypothetical protein
MIPASRPPAAEDPPAIAQVPLGWELEGAQEDVGDDQSPAFVCLKLPPRPRWWFRLWRRFRRGTPSAMEEWLAYYQGRYSLRRPDLSAYRQLLARNGAWHIPSPFVPGSLHAQQFCASGVMLADIVFLMDRWISQTQGTPTGFFDVGQPDVVSGPDAANPYLHDHVRAVEALGVSYPLSQQSVSPIHRHQAMEDRAQDVMAAQDAYVAALCLLSLFSDTPTQWTWLSDHLHIDNRLLLCRIVYDVAPLDDRPRLLRAWASQNWLSKSACDRLAAAFIDLPPPEFPGRVPTVSSTHPPQSKNQE